MKKYINKNATQSKYFPLISLGLLINSGMIIVNRFIVEIPDTIAILLALTGIILMLTSAFLMQKEEREKEDK